MIQTNRRPSRGIVARRAARVGLAAILSAATLAASCSTTLTTGKITGNIGFAPAAPEVVQYLANRPVVADPGRSVEAYAQDGSAVLASTAYAPLAPPTPAGLASYELHPVIGASSPAFRLLGRYLVFSNLAFYRFGDISPIGATQHPTPPVPPETEGALSVDLLECPVLVSMKIKLEGAQQDLNALNAPAACTVGAGIEESPGSFTGQAGSGAVGVSLDDLRGDGAVVPLLVRGSGAAVGFGVACTFDTTVSGFPHDPNAPPNQTFFGTVIGPQPLACGQGLNPVATLHVERTAGTLKGLLDVVGLDETGVRVDIAPPAKGPVNPPGWHVQATGASVDPAPHVWSFDAVSEGRYEVSAKATLDAGRVAVEFPNLAGASAASVTRNQITDLDRTFVARPHVASGSLVFRDPRPLAGLPTNLQWLHTTAFGGFSQWMHTPERTAVVAVGSPDYYVSPSGALGGTGLNAQSLAVPQGSFDAQTGEARLSYAIPLVGLSPANGALDGNAALTTPWRVQSIDIGINKIIGNVQEAFQAVRVNIGRNIPIDAQPGGASQVAEQNICFGEQRLTFVASGNALLYEPYIGIGQAAAIASLDDQGRPITYSLERGRAWGAPRTADLAATSVSVGATLPAGLQYTFTPSVRILPGPGAAETFAQLNAQRVPALGAARCGELVEQCVSLQDGQVNSALSVAITSPASFCQAGSSIPVEVAASASEGTIDRVELSFENRPAETLCGTCAGCTACANPLSASRVMSNVSPGSHALTVRAYGSFACSAETSLNVQTADPSALQCAPAFSVNLGHDEAGIPAGDPRIAAGLTTPTGGACAVSDDRPALFPPGKTTVRYTNSAGTSCTTEVTVLQPQHLAFVDGNVLKVYRLDDNQLQFPAMTLPEHPLGMEYDARGELLAVIGSAQVTVVGALDGSFRALHPGGYSALAFRPTDNRDIAFVMKPISPARNYSVALWSGSTGAWGGIHALEPALAADQTMGAPRIAWSPDGTRLTVAYNIERTSGENHLMFAEWAVSGSQLGVPATTLDGLRNNMAGELPGFWNRERVIAVANALMEDPANFRRLIATNYGIYEVTLNPGHPYELLAARRINSVGLEKNAYPVGVFTWTFPELAAGEPEAVLAMFFGGDIVDGPTVGKNAVAFATYGRRTAVVQPNAVILYRSELLPYFRAFVQDRTFATTEVRASFPRFRPVPR